MKNRFLIKLDLSGCGFNSETSIIHRGHALCIRPFAENGDVVVDDLDNGFSSVTVDVRYTRRMTREIFGARFKSVSRKRLQCRERCESLADKECSGKNLNKNRTKFMFA